MPSSTILGIPSSSYPAPDVDDELAELERASAALDLELARRKAKCDQAMALRQLQEQMTAVAETFSITDDQLAELERISAELDLELARRKAEHDQAMALRRLQEQMTAIELEHARIDVDSEVAPRRKAASNRNRAVVLRQHVDNTAELARLNEAQSSAIKLPVTSPLTLPSMETTSLPAAPVACDHLGLL
jgi:hypothetical protein